MRFNIQELRIMLFTPRAESLIKTLEKIGKIGSILALIAMSLFSISLITFATLDAQRAMDFTNGITKFINLLQTLKFHPWIQFDGPAPKPVLESLSVVCGFLGDIVSAFLLIQLTAMMIRDPTVFGRSAYLKKHKSSLWKFICAHIVFILIFLGMCFIYKIIFSSGFVFHTKSTIALMVMTIMFPPQWINLFALLILLISYLFFDFELFKRVTR